MNVCFDTDKPDDVRLAFDLISKLMVKFRNLENNNKVADGTNEPDELRLAKRLWPHLGQSNRRLVNTVREHADSWPTQEKLAKLLDRPHSSVKASMNARLAMAIANAQIAVFGTSQSVIGLFVWRRNSDGIWEVSMTPAMREAIAAVSKGDFAVLPSAE